jgi:hypothetical protein
MKKLFAIALITVTTTANAGFTYDPQSGNSYSTFGNTTQGWNLNNGTSWSSTTNGSQSYGTDSRGNTWNYDHNSGYYSNSNGTTCFGKGQFRTCN